MKHARQIEIDAANRHEESSFPAFLARSREHTSCYKLRILLPAADRTRSSRGVIQSAIPAGFPMEPAKQITREDLKPGEVLCSYCTARCCRYFAMAIDSPKTWEQFDHIRWYLMHGPFSIFVDGETWYLLIPGDCKHLQEDHRCGTYDTRPQICRTYTTDECEYDNDGVYDQFFETPEQLWEYAQAVLPARLRRTAASPISLPVLQMS
jgi:Fe-S-cluster containining protein